ncbi:MAG: AMIN domain-containing protein, partial [Thermodesulfobacteriota bacterium]
MMSRSNYRIQNTESRLWRTENKSSVVCYLSSVVCLLTIGFIAGCAPKMARIDEGVQFPEKGEMKIERIEVSKAEDGDLVTIKASKPLSYTAFKLTAPLRLIIDIPDIDTGTYKGPIEVGDGIINRINTDLYKEKSGNIGRVEIEIEDGVGYELEPAGDALLVRFEREREREGLEVIRVAADKTTLAPNIMDGVQEKKEKPELTEVASDGGEGQIFPVKVFVAPEIVREAPQSTGKKADRLLSVGVNQLDDNYIEAVLRGDGYIRDYDTFGLDDPERVVIDLWDVESAISDDVLSLDIPNVEMVRIGSHPDKTRVVFDLRGEQKFSYLVEKRGDGLLIAFRGKEGQDTERENGNVTGAGPSPIVPGLLKVAQQVSTQVSKKERIEIKGVDFEDSETSSKVIVTVSDSVEYEIAKSFDGKTVALILKMASLPANLQRTLDTSELNSPVALISSYGSGTGDDEKIMIVMRLKEGAEYEVSRENNILTVEFPKTGVEMVAGAVEDVPPVKVAETETAKEDATLPVEEVVKAVTAKLPLALEKAAASKKQVDEVVKTAAVVKLPPAPEKVAVSKKTEAPKESRPVDKNKEKEK